MIQFASQRNTPIVQILTSDLFLVNHLVYENFSPFPRADLNWVTGLLDKHLLMRTFRISSINKELFVSSLPGLLIFCFPNYALSCTFFLETSPPYICNFNTNYRIFSVSLTTLVQNSHLITGSWNRTSKEFSFSGCTFYPVKSYLSLLNFELFFSEQCYMSVPHSGERIISGYRLR